MEKSNKVYEKQKSFNSLTSKKNINYNDVKKKILKITSQRLYKKDNFNIEDLALLDTIVSNINSEQIKKSDKIFSLKDNSVAELNTYDNADDIVKYLIHRYKYEIFPILKKLDKFPPLVQIEPSSVCNFRCVFCFETDKSFTAKKNGFMGEMKLNLFKSIIDKIEGKVEFLTLASRGEPLVNSNFNKMIEYTANKFLNLKINTNASLLSESKSHSILKSGVKTIVFSADAADSEEYKKMRVNGNLEKTLQNIKMFLKIKNIHYKKNNIITRVSGVKFSENQDFDKMVNFWGDLVDQVAFVEYNPWENSYEKEANDIVTPCSDLWRRMFIWWDGKINPCDVDYKSKLEIDNFNSNKDLTKIWLSEKYTDLRKKHISKLRSRVTPCKSCSVI